MADSPAPRHRFPGYFWAANTMEIFERMGWYGFYAVSSLYLTGAVAEGGLGLSSEDRGVIQGLATFFLYLFPAVFGALADRYGFKQMFLASCGVMIPGYLLLQLPESFWGFLASTSWWPWATACSSRWSSARWPRRSPRRPAAWGSASST